MSHGTFIICIRTHKCTTIFNLLRAIFHADSHTDLLKHLHIILFISKSNTVFKFDTKMLCDLFNPISLIDSRIYILKQVIGC